MNNTDTLERLLDEQNEDQHRFEEAHSKVKKNMNEARWNNFKNTLPTKMFPNEASKDHRAMI